MFKLYYLYRIYQIEKTVNKLNCSVIDKRNGFKNVICTLNDSNLKMPSDPDWKIRNSDNFHLVVIVLFTPFCQQILYNKNTFKCR